MSIAGKRSGLDGNRSSLFYEAIRIIKEMRCATNGKYPRWICWENVPGAYSSNSGEDFKAVLEAVIGVVEPGTQVPVPEKARWPYADCYMGEGWSVAYRTLDAQYWGVPQRRKRIYLVADFAGQCAGKVLFESEGLSRYSAAGFSAWQRASRSSENCPGATGFDGYNGDLTGEVSATLGVNCGMSTGRNGIVLNDQGGSPMDITENVTCTLRAEARHPPCVMEAAVFENHSQDTRYTEVGDTAPTVSHNYGTGGNNQPFVVQAPKTLKIRSGCEGGGKGALVQDDKSATLSCNNDQVAFVPFCKGIRPHSSEEGQIWKEAQVTNTLNTFDVGEGRCNELAVRAFGISSVDSEGMKSANPHAGFYEAATARTLDRGGGSPTCNQGGIAVVCINQGGGKSACGITKEISPTLACTHGGEPAVCVQNNSAPDAATEDSVYTMTTGSYLQTLKNQAPTLMARDYKDPTAVTCNSGQPQYAVRRLTTTECSRLMGFPDWWCADLGTPEPTDADIQFWSAVFETHRKSLAHPGNPNPGSRSSSGSMIPIQMPPSIKCGAMAWRCHAYIMCWLALCCIHNKLRFSSTLYVR